jgi:hypothetical protein
VSTKNTISSAESELDEQLAFVAARVAESEADDQAKLAAIVAAQAKLDDEGSNVCCWLQYWVVDCKQFNKTIQV